jgi:hypothetical protein
MEAKQIPEPFNTITELGRLIRHYPIRRFYRSWNLTITIAMLSSAGLIGLLTLLLAYQRYYRNGILIIWKTVQVPVIFIGILSVIGIIAAWRSLSVWMKAAGIFEGGLALYQNGSLQIHRWNDIETFLCKITRNFAVFIYLGTSHRYELLTRDGHRINLDDRFERIEDLGKSIQDYAFPIIYSRLSDQYSAGRTLFFGPISIHRTRGLGYRHKIYPWNQIARVTVNDGFFWIFSQRNQSGIRVSANRITNLDVLLALITAI